MCPFPEKPLEVAWVDSKVGWYGVSGNHQGGGEQCCLGQLGDSVMVATCLCMLGVGNFSLNNTLVCHFLLEGFIR